MLAMLIEHQITVPGCEPGSIPAAFSGVVKKTKCEIAFFKNCVLVGLNFQVVLDKDFKL